MNETLSIRFTSANKAGNKSNTEICQQSLGDINDNKSLPIRVSLKKISSATIRRKVNEFKLTRQIVGLVTLVVMSEICSILTYEKITEYLIGSHFPGYMNNTYKLQVVISNSIVLIVHSVNFLILSVLLT